MTIWLGVFPAVHENVPEAVTVPVPPDGDPLLKESESALPSRGKRASRTTAPNPLFQLMPPKSYIFLDICIDVNRQAGPRRTPHGRLFGAVRSAGGTPGAPAAAKGLVAG
jgi:hypothetical protein